MPGRRRPASGREPPPARLACEQRVDDRAGLVPGRRMGHEAGRLVDDEDVGVLVDDVERDVLRLEATSARDVGDVELEAGARLHGSRARTTVGRPAVSRPSAMSRCTYDRERPDASATKRSARDSRRARGDLDGDHARHHAWPAPTGRRPAAGQPVAEQRRDDEQEDAMLIAASAMFQAYQREIADAHVHEVDDVAEANAVDEVADGARRAAGRARRVTSGPPRAPWRHSNQQRCRAMTSSAQRRPSTGATASKSPKMPPSL